jgi:hypothetical protein
MSLSPSSSKGEKQETPVYAIKPFNSENSLPSNLVRGQNITDPIDLTEDDEPTEPVTFPQFKQLPAEIQVHIFRMALRDAASQFVIIVRDGYQPRIAENEQNTEDLV